MSYLLITPEVITDQIPDIAKIKGVWNSTDSYAHYDVVTLDGQLWMALGDVSASNTAPVEGADWTLLGFDRTAPGEIGAVTPAAASFTNVDASGTVTIADGGTLDADQAGVTVRVPTVAAGTDDTQAASTAFVKNAITNSNNASLGSIASQNASNVNITGGSISDTNVENVPTFSTSAGGTHSLNGAVTVGGSMDASSATQVLVPTVADSTDATTKAASTAFVQEAIDTAFGGYEGNLGDMAQQNKNAVDIEGGTIDAVDITDSSIDGSPIGASQASSGAFTTLSASGQSSLAAVDAGNTNITGTLDVSGASTLAAVSATNVTASGTLDVTGQSTLGLLDAGNTDITGTLSVSAKSTLAAIDATGNLAIKDGATNKFTVEASSGNTVVAGTLNVTGQATLSDDATVAGDLTVSGDLTVQGTTTTVNSTEVLIADKAITLAANAANDAQADQAGFVIKGTTDKSFLWDNASDDFQSSESLSLASGKEFKINGSSVLSSSTLGSGVTASSLTSVGTLTSLDVSGNSSVGGDLEVTGTTALTGDLTAVNANFTGDVNVDTQPAGTNSTLAASTAYVDGAITTATNGINNTINNLGTMSTQDAVSVAITGGSVDGTAIGATTRSTGAFTTLAADDAVSFTSTLDVTGQSTLGLLDAGNTDITGTLAVSGASTLAAVSATNVTASGTLDVSGASTLAAVSATNVSASGTLGVTGTSTLGVVNAGNTAITGTLSASGASTLAAVSATNVTASGTLGVTGTSTLGAVNAGNTAITGTLSASGASTLAAVSATNVTASGTLGVTGTSTLAAVNATNVAASGTLGVTGYTILSGGLTAGNTTIAGTLNSAGNFSVATNKFTVQASNGNVGVKGYLQVKDNSDNITLSINNLSGDIYAPGASLTMSTVNAGSAILSNSLSVGGVTLLNAGATVDNNVLEALGGEYVSGTYTYGGDSAALIVDGDQRIVNNHDLYVTGNIYGNIKADPNSGAANINYSNGNVAVNVTDTDGVVLYDPSNNALIRVDDGYWSLLNGNGTALLSGGVNNEVAAGFLIASSLQVNNTSNFYNVANMHGYKIESLGTPTASTDAATKAYVDSVASGLDVKNSVKVATTANITLSGTQTIDGVAVSAGDRVLVKNQTTGSQNGIYVVAAGAWSRATDFDANASVSAGAFTFVEEGTANADSGWVLSTDGAITIGTTALSFSQFSGAGSIQAGTGLSKAGNTLNVTIIDGSGNVTVSGTTALNSTLNVTGTSTLAAVNATSVSASGTLSSTGNFAVNTNKFTVAASSGNTVVAGTLNVTGTTTLGETYLSNMVGSGTATINGTFKAGMNGGAGAFTVNGANGNANVYGDFTVRTDKFVVTAASGNTAIAGTLGVTGASTVAAVTASGAVQVNNTLGVTGTATMAAVNATNVAASGTLSSTGNFAVNTDKFTVAASSGNTLVAGTLGVTGTSTLADVTAEDVTADSVITPQVRGSFTIQTVGAGNTSYSLTTAESGVLVDTSAGNYTVNLPSSANSADGVMFTIKKVVDSGSTNTITIQTPGSEKIDGADTKVVEYPNQTVCVLFMNGNWYII